MYSVTEMGNGEKEDKTGKRGTFTIYMYRAMNVLSRKGVDNTSLSIIPDFALCH